MKKILLFLISAMVLTGSMAFAMGGQGATCNPSTAGWPNCTLATVPVREHVTRTVNIPAGHYTAPYIADQANTEYILQGDITADSTAITVKASYVVINLNGHTITYNQVSPGEGVNIGTWNRTHIAVVNGSILQGAAMSEGTSGGAGNNPVSFYNTDLGGFRPASYVHVANLYVKYGGRDVAGLNLGQGGDYCLIEQSTVEDTYEFGTLKNRHAGVRALTVGAGRHCIVRNNTIVNARQGGIDVKRDAEVYGNHVTVRSIAPNSAGIGGWEVENIKIYNNTVVASGESPLGIGVAQEINQSRNVEIYNNIIDSKTTALGSEYGSSQQCFTESHTCGLTAIGINIRGYRTVSVDNLRVYNNKITINNDAWYRGTYSPTGEAVWVNGKAKGFSINMRGTEKGFFYNNHVTVLDKDGKGLAFGVSFPGNTSSGMFFINNTVIANVANVVFGDSYGASQGHPLVAGNHLVKVDDYPTYATFHAGGWHDGTGRVVDNTYSGGASVDSLNFNAAANGILSIYFGTFVDNTILYNYRYHDNNGTSASLIRDYYNPPISLNYAVPTELLPPVGLRIFINQ